MFKVWPAAGFEAGCEAGFRKAARALQVIVRFATDLIAAKPVKPCDGGVSGALNVHLFCGATRALPMPEPNFEQALETDSETKNCALE